MLVIAHSHLEVEPDDLKPPAFNGEEDAPLVTLHDRQRLGRRRRLGVFLRLERARCRRLGREEGERRLALDSANGLVSE